jgi:hypothetical protein
MSVTANTMKTYKVTVSQHWIEHGEIELEAEDAETARDNAKEILTSEPDSITWNRMDPQ